MLPYDVSATGIRGEGKPMEERLAMHRTYLTARDRFYGKPTHVPAVDKSKLSPEGLAHRERIKNLNSGISGEPDINHILRQIEYGRVYQPRTQAISFDDAKLIVTALYNRDLIRKEKTIRLSPDEQLVVDDVTRYFIGDPSSSIPLHKGIFLYGDVGVGKTFLLEKIMRELMRLIPVPLMQFGFVEATTIVDEVKQAKTLQPLKAYNHSTWLIDEMGKEEVVLRLYKDVEERPMDRLLSALYRQYTNNDLRTHATSNKQPSDLEKYYGTRIFDRFGDMFEPVLWPGNDSKRQPPEDEEISDDLSNAQ